MPRNQSAQSAQTESKAPKASKASTESDEVSYSIVGTDVWDPNNHKYGNGKPNKNGQGKSAAFTYGTQKFYLKVPKMSCPFGASKPKPKPGQAPGNDAQFSLQMCFGDDAAGSQFLEKALKLDANMIEEGSKPERTIDWLGAPKNKPYVKEVVESKYSSMVKYPKTPEGEINTQYAAFIRPSFPTSFKNKGEFTCEIYNSKNDLMEVSSSPEDPNFISKLIPPQSQCSALLQGSIWCNTTTGYGITWRIMQLKVFPSKAALPKGKCLVDEPEDDDEDDVDTEEESKPVTPAPTKSAPKPAAPTKPTEEVVEVVEEVEEVVEEDDAAALVQATVAPVEQPKVAAKKPLVKK